MLISLKRRHRRRYAGTRGLKEATSVSQFHGERIRARVKFGSMRTNKFRLPGESELVRANKGSMLTYLLIDADSFHTLRFD
jgi:hypothetical protein